MSDLLAVGTYTETMPHVTARGTGIHLLGFDRRTGAITDGPAVPGSRNPTYLTANRAGTRLYAVEEIGEAEGASADIYRLDAAAPTLTLLERLPALGGAPCHVALDGDERRLFVSNYAAGTFITYPLRPDGLAAGEGHRIRRVGSGPNRARQEGSHIHQGVPTPDGRHVLVADLGADEIARFPLTGSTVAPEPDLVVQTPPGGLPRHLAFLGDGKIVAVVLELGGTVELYGYDGTGLEHRVSAATLPPDWTGPVAAAAIRAHPNGRFLYVSNRGHDSLAGFELAADGCSLRTLGWWPSGGRTPRDFILTDDGRFLVAAHQDSDSIVVFAIDPGNGALTPVAEKGGIGSPVSLHLVRRG
ncbi:lactonase family protein [Aureimonas leprariae]|uniref:Lactonase family protein n=1 Tax=Plantimonas leprariae TaxID=2615207 RepID=A0A7V7PKH9_9HYPH|nr:lactonase family protein [Aureimonas leprariae]KAB0675994.1 lactonase family protein [Aureimonas leprariae]